MNGTDPKQIARELLEEAHPALIGLSHWIHANPELGYQEVLASGWITEWLTTAGFDVRTGMAGMPTAVVGSYGPGPFHIAVCVEYDALPAIGHACGHNVIAAAGVGAGLALAAVADQLGLRVTVMGTPAEETGGGKIGMIKAGEFDGVHAALMVHPWPGDESTPTILAIRSLNVAYTGKEAHAAGFPYLGINAADALVIAQTAIALLRQQLRSTDRVHGIVTKGGDAANIIPSRTEAQWMVRGTDVARLDEVTALVRRCFEAGALATGATLEIEEEICYADVRHDPDLARLYQSNAEQLGRVFTASGMPVSTDMGNVSYVVPSIHPMIGIAADGAVNHQADFAAACATPSADQAIFDGALAMAWTAIDAALDVGLRERLMETRPVGADVAMVSSAWKLPPLVAPVLTEAVAPVELVLVDVDGDGVVDMVAEVEVVAEAAALTDTQAPDDVMAQAVTEVDASADTAWMAEPEPDPDGGAGALLATAWMVDSMAVDEPVADPEAMVGDDPMAGDPFAEAEPAMVADALSATDEMADPVAGTEDELAAPQTGELSMDAEPFPAAEGLAALAWLAEPESEGASASAWMTEPIAAADDAAQAEEVADPAMMADAADAAEPVAEGEEIVSAGSTVDPLADAPTLDADAAWAADVDAVAQQIAEVSKGVGAPEATAEPLPEGMADSGTAWGVDAWAGTSWGEPATQSTPADAEAAGVMTGFGMEPAGEAAVAEEVLFIGFEEPATEASGPVADAAADVWVAPDVPADWVDQSTTPAEAVATVDPGTPLPDDTWFAVDEASGVPAAAAAAMADPAATATTAATAVASEAPTLHDRDAWERAFEEAAARIGWDQQFEDAIGERMTEEGMDRSAAMADLASDLQEAGDDPESVAAGASALDVPPDDAPTVWPPQASEAISRDHVEAEGFSFVAPEVASSRLEEYGEVWSRNGADHASEDISLR